MSVEKFVLRNKSVFIEVHEKINEGADPLKTLREYSGKMVFRRNSVPEGAKKDLRLAVYYQVAHRMKLFEDYVA